MKRLSLIFALFLLMAQPTRAIAPTKPVEYPEEIFRPVSVPALVTPEPSIRKESLTIPTPTPKVKESLPTKAPSPLTPTKSSRYTWDNEVSWYGPGFYGNRTACGLALTTELLGVAHRSLPCGTKVEFRHGNRHKIVPVVDRGPYVAGRQWDLTGGLCVYLDHCFTGAIEYRIVK